MLNYTPPPIYVYILILLDTGTKIYTNTPILRKKEVSTSYSFTVTSFDIHDTL